MVWASGRNALSSACPDLVPGSVDLFGRLSVVLCEDVGTRLRGLLRGWAQGRRKTVTVDVGARPYVFVVPMFSPGNRHKRGFSGNYGCCSGVSWLVMGAGVWLSGEIRSGRSGRCALVCDVHQFTVRPRRGIC